MQQILTGLTPGSACKVSGFKTRGADHPGGAAILPAPIVAPAYLSQFRKTAGRLVEAHEMNDTVIEVANVWKVFGDNATHESQRKRHPAGFRDFAIIGFFKPGNQPKGGRFSTAAAPQQDGDFTFGEGEIYMVDSLRLPVPFANLLKTNKCH